MDGYRIATVAGVRTFALWCKGCSAIHHVPIDGSRGWGWNEETQSLTPSVKHSRPDPTAAVRHSGVGDVSLCHYLVKNGHIEYLDDCAEHSLRGLHPLDEAPPANYGGREWFGWDDASGPLRNSETGEGGNSDA